MRVMHCQRFSGFLAEDVAWRRIVKIVGARRTSEMPSPTVVSRGASKPRSVYQKWAFVVHLSAGLGVQERSSEAG